MKARIGDFYYYCTGTGFPTGTGVIVIVLPDNYDWYRPKLKLRIIDELNNKINFYVKGRELDCNLSDDNDAKLYY
jgi:hypothetical protein